MHTGRATPQSVRLYIGRGQAGDLCSDEANGRKHGPTREEALRTESQLA